MSFKNHYLALPVNERESLALQAGTTRGTLNQVVYGGKQIELGLADCLIALCVGLKLSDLPLTDRAKLQDSVRSGSDSETPTTNRRKADLKSDVVDSQQLVSHRVAVDKQGV